MFEMYQVVHASGSELHRSPNQRGNSPLGMDCEEMFDRFQDGQIHHAQQFVPRDQQCCQRIRLRFQSFVRMLRSCCRWPHRRRMLIAQPNLVGTVFQQQLDWIQPQYMLHQR